MQSLIEILDKNLKYINHQVIEDTIIIQVKSHRHSFQCPHCNKISNKIHSKYKRIFKIYLFQVKR